MAIEIVDFPIKNGGSFHGKMLVHRRVFIATIDIIDIIDIIDTIIDNLWVKYYYRYYRYLDTWNYISSMISKTWWY